MKPDFSYSIIWHGCDDIKDNNLLLSEILWTFSVQQSVINVSQIEKHTFLPHVPV